MIASRASLPSSTVVTACHRLRVRGDKIHGCCVVVCEQNCGHGSSAIPLQRDNERQFAVTVGRVHAIADHEFFAAIRRP